MVGGCSKQEEGDPAVWFNFYYLLYFVLDFTFCEMRKMNLMFFVVLFVAAACNKKEQNNVEVTSAEQPKSEINVPNERPRLNVMLQDGRNVDLRTLEENFMLVLFNPTCDHCHDQARQIKNKIAAFSKYNIYFVSSESMDIVQQFAKQLELENLKNVYFGTATGEKVYEEFGPISTPSTYIYKKDGSLVESFDGLVDVEVMMKYL